MFQSVIHWYMIQLLQYIFITLRDDKITKCKRGFSKSKKKNLLLIQVIYKHKIFILSFDMLHLQLVPMISENQFHHFLNFMNFFSLKIQVSSQKPYICTIMYDLINSNRNPTLQIQNVGMSVKRLLHWLISIEFLACILKKLF